MEDGILSLKIYCGKPYELDDEETILIRWKIFVKKQQQAQQQETINNQQLQVPVKFPSHLIFKIQQPPPLPPISRRCRPNYAFVRFDSADSKAILRCLSKVWC